MRAGLHPEHRLRTGRQHEQPFQGIRGQLVDHVAQDQHLGRGIRRRRLHGEAGQRGTGARRREVLGRVGAVGEEQALYLLRPGLRHPPACDAGAATPVKHRTFRGRPAACLKLR